MKGIVYIVSSSLLLGTIYSWNMWRLVLYFSQYQFARGGGCNRGPLPVSPACRTPWEYLIGHFVILDDGPLVWSSEARPMLLFLFIFIVLKELIWHRIIYLVSELPWRRWGKQYSKKAWYFLKKYFPIRLVTWEYFCELLSVYFIMRPPIGWAWIQYSRICGLHCYHMCKSQRQ